MGLEILLVGHASSQWGGHLVGGLGRAVSWVVLKFYLGSPSHFQSKYIISFALGAVIFPGFQGQQVGVLLVKPIKAL